MHFEWPFGGSWVQHGPKSLLKAPPNKSQLSLFLGSWRVLGDSWGLLGPKNQFYRFFVDVWSIFDPFLSNSGRFLGEISNIFDVCYVLLAMRFLHVLFAVGYLSSVFAIYYLLFAI